MIQYAPARWLGTADAKTMLQRFTRSSCPPPTYHAVIERGNVIKTILLCQYLQEEALRREIHDGLQVIDNWTSANACIFYGKGGEMATNRLADQAGAVLPSLSSNSRSSTSTRSCCNLGLPIRHGAHG